MKTINKIRNSIFFKIKYTLPIFILLLAIGCKKQCEYYKSDCKTGMDVAFLIDYTGSMGGAIDSIKASVLNIAGAINTKSVGNYRLSLSIFDENAKGVKPAYFLQPDYLSLPASNKIINSTGATTEQYLTMMETFATANTTSFAAQLAKLNGTMTLGNGNGVAEPGGMLLDKIVNTGFAGTWRTGVTKLAIIITDAPDGGDDDNNTTIDDAFLNTLAAQADAAQIQCILVTTLPNSNYQLQLINRTANGLRVVKPNFNNISTNIIQMINQVCQ